MFTEVAKNLIDKEEYNKQMRLRVELRPGLLSLLTSSSSQSSDSSSQDSSQMSQESSQEPSSPQNQICSSNISNYWFSSCRIANNFQFK